MLTESSLSIMKTAQDLLNFRGKIHPINVTQDTSNDKTVTPFIEMQLNTPYLVPEPSQLLDCTRTTNKLDDPIKEHRILLRRTKKWKSEKLNSQKVRAVSATEPITLDHFLSGTDTLNNATQPDNKGKDSPIDLYKCNSCPFATLKLPMLERHLHENSGRCADNVKVLQCPACNYVFTAIACLRVHLSQDHNMIPRDVKLILSNLHRIRLHILGTNKTPPCAFVEQNDIDFSADDTEGPMALAIEQQRPSCAKEKRNVMLEAYLDNISDKTTCLPPGIAQSGTDLLENTFNFTAPVSEQLPSIQPENPPPSNVLDQQEDEELITESNMDDIQPQSHFLAISNVFGESQQNEYSQQSGDGFQQTQEENVDYQFIEEIEDNRDFNSFDYTERQLQTGKPKTNSTKKPNYGFRCDINGCKIRMQTEKNIQYHRRCHENTMFNCPECCKDCPTWVSLSGHLWQVHQIDMELYKCDQCPYRTPKYSTLTGIHRGIHGTTKPYLCDICGKGFKTVKQMRNHKVVHKAKMVRMSGCFCEICGRTLSSKRLLKVHIGNLHKNKKPFLCSICGFTTGVKHSLNLHMRKHTGEKPHKCDKCDYTTADHNSLRKHKMKHTGARLYKCPHCMYSSIQSSTYKTHLKRKHPGLEATIIFSCSLCNFHTLQHGLYLAHTAHHADASTASVEPKQQQISENRSNNFQNTSQDSEISLGPLIDPSEPIVELTSDHTILQDDDYYNAVESL